jgi:23S rRNA pseudouridine1911/1915/1917 synthase
MSQRTGIGAPRANVGGSLKEQSVIPREAIQAPMLDVLLEDNHCLAVNKPAGLLAQGDETGEPSLVDLVRDYLRAKYAKPGNVFVGLVHRLDRPTSGVVLLAKTSKGADRLAKQFREGTVRKVYRAVVEGSPPLDEGEWVDRLAKDEARNIVRVVAPGDPGGRDAHVAYRVLARHAGTTGLELIPTTGRGHQLRVQLASRGMPIVGDRKYGARSTLLARDGRPRVALHALSLTFRHPTRPEELTVTAPMPREWPATDSRR